MSDVHAQADAETYLVHVLETSDPRREASGYNITQAAQELHESTGSWDLRSADHDVIEKVLAKHTK